MTTAARRTRAPGPPPGRIHPRRPKGTPAMDQPATRQRSVGRRPAATHHSASSRPPALLEAAGLESLVRARHPSTGAHSRTPWWGRRSTSPRSCRRSLPDIPLRLERGRQLHLDSRAARRHRRCRRARPRRRPLRAAPRARRHPRRGPLGDRGDRRGSRARLDRSRDSRRSMRWRAPERAGRRAQA
jgi:hypothetical protein